MLSVDSQFTPLEQAVLRAICEKYPADRSALESQLFAVTLVRRENTGAGFYTHFTVERMSGTAVGGERLRNGPVVRVDGLKHGMGFILWLENGYAHRLEAYSYDESTTAIVFERVGFTVPPLATNH